MSKFPSSLFPIDTPDGASEYQFLGLVPYAMNESLAYLSKDVIQDDTQGTDSVTNTSNWSVTPVDPRVASIEDPTRFFIPEGEAVATYLPEIGIVRIDEDDTKQIHLLFSNPLENGVRYDVTMSANVKGSSCEDLTGVATRRFKSLNRGLGPVPRYTTEDIYRDFAMTYFPSDSKQPQATWRFDTTTDIGIQTATESLEKRVIRRIITPRGGFKFLGQDYGIDLDIKKLARSGKLQEIANRTAEQIRKEPDVQDVGVEASLVAGADGRQIVQMSVIAIRRGETIGRFTLQLPSA